MYKASVLERLLRDRATPLAAILIILALITMVISSGVLDGEPASALFTAGFMSGGNLLNVFYDLVIQCVMLCGLALLLISGNIDLSVSAQAALGTMIFGLICRDTPLPWFLALLITLAIAGCIGFFHATLVNKLHFPSFIATIGMSSVYNGLCRVLTGGNNIQINRTGFLEIGKSHVFDKFPTTFLFAVLLVILFQFILSRTAFGRSVYMAGGNPFAARLSGLNPDRIRTVLFVSNGVLAALGGLLWTAQTKIASPTAFLQSMPDMRVISSSILGGVSFFGGAGNLGGPFVALLLLNIFENMLAILNVQSYWSIFMQGFLLAFALIIDYISTERKKRKLLRI
ncbi:MAG: ABC transporter permease [Clostridiales Family XIII bacterium]|jgi:ribose transport system permease protein|nr:ABC transporter permease [Clostridiales Family XIII bacterium]